MNLNKIIAFAVTLWGAVGFAQAQTTVRGRITDTDGEPLAGAAVLNRANRQGVVAENDGTYSIRINGPSTLEFSFMGFETLTMTFSGERNEVRNIVMKSSNELEEAVISAGYGVIQKRENFTGSAFQLTSEDLQYRPHDRLDNMLAGMVPGMAVTEESVSGSHSSIHIRIRGDGSLSASNEPLWVIDGVPVYTGNRTGQVIGSYSDVSPLSHINPDDIEDITVLKDATTTTLYGADGANGVILVTTRNASSGANKFNVNVKYGIDNVDNSTRVKYLSADQWWTVAQEAWTNSGRDIRNFPFQDNEYQTFHGVDTDWFKVYVGTGQTFEANFSVTGGTDKLKHYLSSSVYTSASPYLGNGQTRVNARERTVFKISKHLEADFQLSGGYQRNNIFSISGFSNYLTILSPWNDDGSYRLYNYYSITEDYQVVQRRFIYNKLPEREYDEHYQDATFLESALTLSYTPFKDLVLTSQTSANFQNIYESLYSTHRTLSGINSSDPSLSGYSRRHAVFDRRILQNLRANYRHTFASRHAVSATLGWEFVDKVHPYLQASGNGFANDYIREIQYANSTTQKGTSNTSHSRSLSYLGNANYTYDNRYSLTLTARRQGDSAFSEYSRWQSYAAVAGRWNIHREQFFSVPWISQLSLRLSYGANGNSRVDNSSSFGTFSITGNYGPTPAAVIGTPANPGLSWEKTYTLNPGLNLGLFKGRLNLDIDYYNRRTHDVIYSGRVSSVITEGSVSHNVGIIENQGFEIALNSVNIQRENFTWSTYFNGARNRNIIRKLEGDAYTGFFDHIWIEGQQKDAMWLIQYAGVDPTTGQRMYYDRNGDLTYTANYADRVYMPQYSSQPALFGGVSNSFQFFKHWNAQIMFDYTLGGWFFNRYNTLSAYDMNSVDSNKPVEVLDHWTTPGQGSSVPRIQYKNNLTTADTNTPYELFNKTSIQVRSASLGYTLPKTISDKMHLKTATVSLIGNNLYFWTIGQSANRNSYKTLRDPYGMHRTVSLSVNLSF